MKTTPATLLIGAVCSVVLPAVLLAQQPAPASGARTVWDGVYTDEQAVRGATAYAARCASCHGASMEGGEMAPGLAGPTFLGNWDGLTAGDLFERTRTTMPLDEPGALSRAQVADITAAMLRANGFPAGPASLDARTDVLGQVRIQSYKTPDGR